MKQLKISVITIVLNSVATIEKTITSVLSQNYDQLEYIVLDGISTDGTLDIIRKYADGIRIFVSEADHGIYDAMNKAISLCSGDVIIFMNSGDYFMNENAIKCAMDRFDDNTDILIAKELIEGRVCDTFSAEKNRSIYIDAFFPHQATFSRTSLFEKDGLYDETYRICADYDWILREYYRGRRIKWIDDVVSVYDADGVSSSVKCTAEQYVISHKYLLLSDRSDLIPYMEKYYSEMYRKVFFRRLIKDSISNNTVSKVLKRELEGFHVSIWGFGTIGKALCSFLISNKIKVKHIFDSNPVIQNIDYLGVPTLEYNSRFSDYVIVASEQYDTDICSYLKSIGKKPKEDFISYADFSLKVVVNLLRMGYDDQGFATTTGIDVLQYLCNE